jgi:hypothetical protein
MAGILFNLGHADIAAAPADDVIATQPARHLVVN